jgi:quercetin dioxygenase-like cupin family protein
MSDAFTFLADLAREVELPHDGTFSRTLLNDDRVKIVLFGFSAGQELSEHTATMPAVLQFVSGEAAVKLGTDWHDARPGSFVHMPAGLPHAIRTKAPTVMLLILVKQPPAHGSSSPPAK